MLVERGIAAVGSGVEDSLGGVEEFVDQFDVFHHFPVFVFEQGSKVLALGLQLAAVGVVKTGERVDVIVAGGDEVLSMRLGRAVEDAVIKLGLDFL